jgi:hypothetical protein
MNVITLHRLIDGPLMPDSDRRRQTIERMAIDLIQCGRDITSNRDAVSVLLAKGYPKFDVAACAPEARTLAYQEIVAAEMSKP